MRYELTEEQIKNLGLFLGRVDLKGSEVGAFNDLVKALNSPIKEEINVKEAKK